MKALVPLVAFALTTSCERSQHAPGNSGRNTLEISIEKRGKHPFLVDHGRALVASIDGKKIAEKEIYADPGGGVPIHYVEGASGITAIDGNGIWYQITEDGITEIGWKWMEPLPTGKVQRIVLDEDGEYTTEPVDDLDLGSVYAFKDPPN